MVTIGSQSLRFDFRRLDEVGVQRRSRPLERIRQQVTVGFPICSTLVPMKRASSNRPIPAAIEKLGERMPQRIGGTVSGFERDGIPFLQAGDEFSLTLRECVGKATEAGLAGLRKLVVKELSP